MKRFPTLLVLFLALASVSWAQTEREVVTLNSKLTAKLVDRNQDLRKTTILLDEKKADHVENRGLILGASLIAIADYQRSNRDSKFAYLMRHPTAKNAIGKEASEAVIHSAQISMVGSVNSWISSFVEILYNPEQSFGVGTITALNRNQLQLRRGFLLLGDLKKFPLYLALGKMDAPFGQTGSVSPFTNSTMWHAFGGLGYGMQIGYKKYGIDASIMVAQGGSQFRALHTPVGDSTSVPSKLNNFVADINYTIAVNDDLKLRAGASYVHGSAYCHQFPVTHFSDCAERNPAYAFYACMFLRKNLLVKAGYAQTFNEWPGTHNPLPPLNQFAAAKVSSLDFGGRYTFNPNADYSFGLSAEFSNFVAGPSGAPWERQSQLVLGVFSKIYQSSTLFLELFQTKGYAPLNFISGSFPDAPFPLGVTHSDAGAESLGIVIGGQITI